MKVFVLLILSAHILIENEAAMTDAQLKAALKLLRNVCQPKNKATNEQIEAMHKGDRNQDKNGMCYMHCVLNMYKLIKKDNTLDYEVGMSTIEAQAPDSIKATAIHSLNSCKDAAKTTSDKCIAAFEIAHCLYLDNPPAYFLP
uniref:Odorant binding protein 12 n=1 Tax=Harmonia axyridis TaxID=115357 RepID=A0A8K1AMY0_HARAX|nr:odorant binding protein 12 [Harmonia axyridis]